MANPSRSQQANERIAGEGAGRDGNKNNANSISELSPNYEMPYINCTDFEMFENLQNNHQNITDLLNSKNLQNSIIQLISNYHENFNCSYQNESSFQNLNRNHNHKSLRSIHLNIRSLNKHKLILKSFLNDLNCCFDIIFLSETGNANIGEIEEVFDNYNFFIDTPKSGKGSKGGSGILVNKKSFDSFEEILESDCLNSNCKCTKCVIENKWMKLTSNKKSYIIGSIYRHPNGNTTHFIDSLNNILHKLDKNSTVIIAGDININLLDHQNTNVKAYLDTLMEHNILPCICIPTRITDTTATIIDHINVRLPIDKISTKISSGNIIKDISDHLPNFLLMDTEVKKTEERPLIRLYTKKNIEIYKENIAKEPPLLPHPRSNDPNLLLAEFTFNLNKMLNKYFPLTRTSRKKFKEKFPMSKKIESMIDRRNKL